MPGTGPCSSITGMGNISSPPWRLCKSNRVVSAEEGRICRDDKKSENKNEVDLATDALENVGGQ